MKAGIKEKNEVMINQQLIMNRYLDFAHHFYADVIFCDCLYMQNLA